jgi:hypothetical protein
VPLLYAAKTGPNLSELFKPTIELSAPSIKPNQSFSFAADGLVAGKTNWFQFATNLSSTNLVWRTLLTNVVTTNHFLFVDTNASGSAQRFYRVLESY